MFKEFIAFGRSIADGHWLAYDSLKELEQVCRDESGKRIYRGGQLVWKTKALITEDRIQRLNTLVLQK